MVFENDLINGQYFEIRFLKHIPHKSYKQSQGNFKEYDLIVYKKNGLISTYEIKADYKISKTNNICIEYECRKKPSGITTSTAKYWGIFNVIDNETYELYKIPRKVLLLSIENKEYSRTINGGDNYVSKLYLFDKNLFKDYIIYSNIND